MELTIRLTPEEVETVRKALKILTDGESENYLNWDDPADIAQAVEDVISEVLI